MYVILNLSKLLVLLIFGSNTDYNMDHVFVLWHLAASAAECHRRKNALQAERRNWAQSCVVSGPVTMAGSARSGCQIWFRLITAGLGVLMGFMVFFVFTFGYGNIAAGCWALISALFAGLVLQLHLLYRSHRLELYYSTERLNLVMLVHSLTYYVSGCLWLNGLVLVGLQ